jgi:hypothetical protein
VGASPLLQGRFANNSVNNIIDLSKLTIFRPTEAPATRAAFADLGGLPS